MQLLRACISVHAHAAAGAQLQHCCALIYLYYISMQLLRAYSRCALVYVYMSMQLLRACIRVHARAAAARLVYTCTCACSWPAAHLDYSRCAPVHMDAHMQPLRTCIRVHTHAAAGLRAGKQVHTRMQLLRAYSRSALVYVYIRTSPPCSSRRVLREQRANSHCTLAAYVYMRMQLLRA